MKNKGLVAIIIILLLGLCGSVGYIVYDKVMVQEEIVQKEGKNSKGEKGVEEKSNKSLTEKDVSVFMKKIDFLNTYYSKKYPVEDISKISNQDVLLLGEVYASHGIFTQGGVTGFTGNVIREGVISIIGSDYSVKMEDINCFAGDGVLYQYNASTDEYHKIGNHGHDGIRSERNKAFFQDGTYDLEKDMYEIRVKVVSSDGCGGTCGPRINFYDAFQLDKVIYNTEEDTDYDTVYQKVSDQLSTITYQFIKNSDGGYGLKSVTLK